MKKTICIILILFVAINASSQNNVAEMPNLVPPSPNARNFLKYGDHPVSNYTGTPNIDIPIYTVQLKDISLPISLSYNASGIKVEEEASRVGLGWVLNAGGMISHTVMGRYQDFCEWVYFRDGVDNKLSDITNIYNINRFIINGPRTGLPFTLENMTRNDFYKALTTEEYRTCGGTELAPDIFNYSFAGYSGKFIFSHLGHIIKEKEDNVIITPIKTYSYTGHAVLKSWVATTPDGTQYYFEMTEKTTFPDRPSEENYNSCYYLTKIKSINGSTINLNYRKSNSHLGSFNRTQDSRLTGTGVTINHAYYEVVYLDNITYPGGRVRFEYAFNREDYEPEPKLTTILLDDENNNNKSKWHLSYDYFVSNFKGIDRPTLEHLNNILRNYSYYNSGFHNNFYTESWNKKRLKLTEIKHTNGTINEKKYKFSYNETSLPTKLSTSIDHWGYHNGAVNSTLIPTIYQNVAQGSESIRIESAGLGANRNVNPTYNQAFLLKEITYPTGGKSQFKYDTHTYITDNFENDPFKGAPVKAA